MVTPPPHATPEESQAPRSNLYARLHNTVAKGGNLCLDFSNLHIRVGRQGRRICVATVEDRYPCPESYLDVTRQTLPPKQERSAGGQDASPLGSPSKRKRTATDEAREGMWHAVTGRRAGDGGGGRYDDDEEDAWPDEEEEAAAAAGPRHPAAESFPPADLDELLVSLSELTERERALTVLLLRLGFLLRPPKRDGSRIPRFVLLADSQVERIAFFQGIEQRKQEQYRRRLAQQLEPEAQQQQQQQLMDEQEEDEGQEDGEGGGPDGDSDSSDEEDEADFDDYDEGAELEEEEEEEEDGAWDEFGNGPYGGGGEVEDAPWLEAMLAVIANLLQLPMAEEQVLHKMALAFPLPRDQCALSSLLARQLQRSRGVRLREAEGNDAPAPAFSRLCKAFVHAELLACSKETLLKPDVALLVSCPEACPHHSAVAAEPTHHVVLTSQALIRDIPLLHQVYQESSTGLCSEEARRAWWQDIGDKGMLTEAEALQVTTVLESKETMSDFGLQTCDLVLKFTRMGMAPARGQSNGAAGECSACSFLGASAQTSLGSLVQIGTRWGHAPLLRYCELELTTALKGGVPPPKRRKRRRPRPPVMDPALAVMQQFEAMQQLQQMQQMQQMQMMQPFMAPFFPPRRRRRHHLPRLRSPWHPSPPCPWCGGRRPPPRRGRRRWTC